MEGIKIPKYTYQDLIKIDIAINNAANLKGDKFAYAMAKNQKTIRKVIVDLQKEMIMPSSEYREYDDERLDICKMFSDKDENGNPIIENGKYKIDNQKKFKKETDKLREEYKDIVEEQEDKIKEYQEKLKEEVNVELYKVKKEYLPKDITPMQLGRILSLIEE